MKRLLWAIPVLLALAFWASTSPDGLQWVGARLGLAEEPPVVGAAPMPDYALGGSRWGGLLAGLLGCGLVYVLANAFQRLARRRRPTSTPPAAPPRR